jgi:hypothetical protein
LDVNTLVSDNQQLIDLQRVRKILRTFAAVSRLSGKAAEGHKSAIAGKDFA